MCGSERECAEVSGRVWNKRECAEVSGSER